MLDSKFLQLVLWAECNSNCVFCLNKRGIEKNLGESKLRNLKSAISLVKGVSSGEYKFVGLIGGEFFQGQIDSEIEGAFIELVDLLHSKIKSGVIQKVFIATSLMGSSNYEIFLRYFNKFKKDEILICTSYNEVGQFSVNTKQNWLRNFDLFLNNGYSLHIEIIASEANLQAILEGRLDLSYWVENNVRIDFLRPIDFEDKRKQEFPWFFPKRATFIQFMLFLERKFPKMLDDFMSLKQRASELHNFTFDMTVRRQTEFDEGEGYLMDCGHSEMFKAYIDCDNCMACDIIKFQKRNKYRTIDKEI